MDLLDISPAVPVPSRLLRTGEVLAHIRRLGTATIGELADVMGAARSTVAERVERLAGHQLLTAESISAGRGRPASTYSFNPRGGSILTAQVGMTGVRIGIADLAGDLIADRMLEIPIAAGEIAIADTIEAGLRSLVDTVESDRSRRIDGVGIGLPGAVELRSLDGGWNAGRIGERLSAAFRVPTFVDHDVNLLALGQYSVRAGRGALMCVKVGSVIGCGVVAGGRIVPGADGLAGEIGHTRVPGRTELCACGNRGCLSATAGGAALARQLSADGFEARHPLDVVRLVDDGVGPAIAAVRQAGRDIGAVLAAAVNLLNPGTIALWGYLVGAEEVLVAGIRQTLYEEANPAAAHRLELVSTELGDLTGLRGAALMVAAEVLAPEAIDLRFAAPA